MSTHVTKKGDYHRQLQLTLSDLSTTGASAVRFRMRPRQGGTLTVDRNGAIDSATQVSLQFQAPELDTVGEFDLEVSLTYVDGTETVPTSGYVRVIVEPTLS